MSTLPPATERIAPPPRRILIARVGLHALDVTFLLGAIAILTAAALLSLGEPEQVVIPGAGWVLPGTCTLKVAMGVGCPGCGLTRCFIAMAHGDLAAAWRFSPVGILMFAILATQVPYRGWKLWQAAQGTPLIPNYQRQLNLTIVVMGTVTVSLVLQWILRLSLGTVP